MVRWKASNLGIPTAPATQGGAGLERNMHFHNTIVDSHLTSIWGGQFVTEFWGKYGPCAGQQNQKKNKEKKQTNDQ